MENPTFHKSSIKTHLLSFIIIFFLSMKGYSQPKMAVEKIKTSAQIWGFLKYYHPNVADGSYNWDQEWIKIYGKIKEASTSQDLSNLYLNWINSLGKVEVVNSILFI